MPTKTYAQMPRGTVSGASAAPFQMTARRRRVAVVNWTVLEGDTSRRQVVGIAQPRVIPGRVIIHPPEL